MQTAAISGGRLVLAPSLWMLTTRACLRERCASNLPCRLHHSQGLFGQPFGQGYALDQQPGFAAGFPAAPVSVEVPGMAPGEPAPEDYLGAGEEAAAEPPAAPETEKEAPTAEPAPEGGLGTRSMHRVWGACSSAVACRPCRQDLLVCTSVVIRYFVRVSYPCICWYAPCFAAALEAPAAAAEQQAAPEAEGAAEAPAATPEEPAPGPEAEAEAVPPTQEEEAVEAPTEPPASEPGVWGRWCTRVPVWLPVWLPHERAPPCWLWHGFCNWLWRYCL